MPTPKIRFGAGAFAGAAVALWLTPAYPHAVCGDRIFPATLAIDDPGVTDELTLPTVSYVPFNSDSAHEWDASFSSTKTITPGLSVVIGSGPTWEHPGGYGWNALDTELQWQALCIPDAEFSFQTPIHNGAVAGQTTTGYFQPGAVYITDKWQFALEAMVPMTGATGHGVGVIGSLDFYLDDIFPDTLGRPIFPHGLGIAPGI